MRKIGYILLFCGFLLLALPLFHIPVFLNNSVLAVNQEDSGALSQEQGGFKKNPIICQLHIEKLELPNFSMQGNLSFRSDSVDTQFQPQDLVLRFDAFTADQIKIKTAVINLHWPDKSLDVQNALLETLSGTFNISAKTFLTDFFQTSSEMQFNNIEVKLLSHYWSILKPGGPMSGHLSLGPLNDPEKPETLKIKTELQLTGPISTDGLQLTSADLTASIDKQRFFISQADVRLLGGVAHPSVEFKIQEGFAISSLTSDFNDLDLHQALHFIHPRAGPTPGRFGGTVSFVSPWGWDSAKGQAFVNLRQSDIAQDNIIASPV